MDSKCVVSGDWLGARLPRESSTGREPEDRDGEREESVTVHTILHAVAQKPGRDWEPNAPSRLSAY
jgi:hypothetical protein